MNTLTRLSKKSVAVHAYLGPARMDLGDEWYWRAPGSFHGNLCRYYGGTLSFHLRGADGEPQTQRAGVTVVGRNGMLVFDLPPAATDDNWTAYSVPIEPDPGWRDSPTEDDIRQLLANVTEVLIHGGGLAEQRGLDNVQLAASSRVPKLFTSAGPCDDAALEKKIQMVAVDEPFEELPDIPAGTRFRIKLVFEEAPGTENEPVVIRTSASGRAYRFNAVMTDDPTVYVTDPISMVPTSGSEGK